MGSSSLAESVGHFGPPTQIFFQINLVSVAQQLCAATNTSTFPGRYIQPSAPLGVAR